MDGSYFKMQSFTQALIDLVVRGEVERDVAANAATSRHDFLVALDHALKQQVVDEQAAFAPSQDDELGGLRLVTPGEQ